MKNNKLRAARAEKGMTQQQLADSVGVSRRTISMIETGSHNPTIELCLGICRKLGKTLNDLFWQAIQQTFIFVR
jgi:putative transcriptional regulator